MADLITWCRLMRTGPACAIPCDDCRATSGKLARAGITIDPDRFYDTPPTSEETAMANQSDTTTLSDFDLMVLVSFKAKVEWEGSRRYTYDNWTWEFETPELAEHGATYTGFMAVYRENQDAIGAWEAAHGEDCCDLINAHHDEVTRRRDDACLWAVRRNDGRVFPQKTRESADWYLGGNVPGGITFAVLHRDVPGGDWVKFAPATGSSDEAGE